MNKTTISIPTSLVDKIKKHIKDFESVDEYVTYVLRETISNVEEEEDIFTEEEEKQIEERLKSLGYLPWPC